MMSRQVNQSLPSILSIFGVFCELRDFIAELINVFKMSVIFHHYDNLFIFSAHRQNDLINVNLPALCVALLCDCWRYLIEYFPLEKKIQITITMYMY